MCIQRASQTSSGIQSDRSGSSFPIPVRDSCSSSTWIPCPGTELLLEGSRKFLHGGVEAAPPEIGVSLLYSYIKTQGEQSSRSHRREWLNQRAPGSGFIIHSFKHLPNSSSSARQSLSTGSRVSITRQSSIFKKEKMFSLPRKGQQK